MIIELPKIYLFAIFIAAALHILCMQKWNEYHVIYEFSDSNNNRYKAEGTIKIKGDSPEFDREEVRKKLTMVAAGEVPEIRERIMIVSWTRTNYGWAWKMPFA